MYENMAKDADEEGFTDLAAKFRAVGAIEKSMNRDTENSCPI